MPLHKNKLNMLQHAQNSLRKEKENEEADAIPAEESRVIRAVEDSAGPEHNEGKVSDEESNERKEEIKQPITRHTRRRR